MLCEERPAVVGGDRSEDVRHPVAGEQGDDLVRARRAGIPDDGQLSRSRQLRPRPLVDEFRDGPVKELVRGAPRLQDVVVDPALRHRAENRVGRPGVGPRAPVDEQAALRVRVQALHATEQLGAAETLEPLVGEDDRDLLAVRRHPLEVGERRHGRVRRDDPVVGGVAAAELLRGAFEGVVVAVDDEEGWGACFHQRFGL